MQLTSIIFHAKILTQYDIVDICVLSAVKSTRKTIVFKKSANDDEC